MPEDDTEARLRKVADDLVSDPRFVARLADLTGVFPVEKQVLERARRVCVETAGRRPGG